MVFPPSIRRAGPTPSSRPTGATGVSNALAPIVGRDRELALAHELLQRPQVRLLTLTGPGGIGKTRLALRLAADLTETFADGVAFVPLESVRDPSRVAAAIARMVGAPQSGDVPMPDALIDALRPARMLVVVDNFEHVLPAAPVAAALLAGCPGLKILVTSRVLLRVTGEHAMAIPPLGLPDFQASPSPEDILRSPAVRLFAERAQAADVTFTIAEADAPRVAEICRRLDGLPLAIELVAPRVRHLALPELIDRLDRRLPLLVGGPREQPSRLQTMRNAIAWSHDLLAPGEQELFRRLAVFTGGFSLAAAEQVVGEGPEDAGGDQGDRPAFDLDGLSALIDASLLQVEIPRGGTARYRMLETIREFALERLGTSGEEDRIRRSHAACFLHLIEQLDRGALATESDVLMSVLEADQANLRAALGWLEEAGEIGPFLRLAAALGRFWSAVGHYPEGRAWLERALAHDGPAADRAKALVALGMIEVYQGRLQEAEASLVEGLFDCRNHGNAFDAARALVGLGALATMRGDLDRGAEHLEACLATSRTVADRRSAGILEGWAHINLAVIARALGDHALASERLREALRCLRDAGDTAGTIMALGDLGDVARDLGDLGRALALYRDALALGRERPGAPALAYVIESVGVVAVTVGQAKRGARLLGACEALRERVGLRYRVTENQVALERALEAAREALGEATFATAWTAGLGLGPAQALNEALEPFPVPAGDPAAVASLTPREIEILHHLAAGETDAEIAATLYISVRTVENHVAHILAKLEVHSRAAAVRAAGLVPPSGPHGAGPAK